MVQYADGAREHIPVRYGREVLAATGAALPQRTDDPVWLIEEAGLRCLVREWPNPRPEQTVQQVSFEPAPALLEMGASVVAATAATAP